MPEVEELRRDLLARAQRFYTQFMQQAPTSEALRRDVAFAHFRLGHIDRMLEKRPEAEKEYREAIARFEALVARSPGRADDRQALANAYNWLGETLRPQPARASDAERAYGRAFELQRALADAAPGDSQIRRELARSHYNLGILLSAREDRQADAERDFRAAIALLEPLAASGGPAAQELARAYNNLGSLLDLDPKRSGDVRALWERAVAIDERLVADEPGNRDYEIELATYCANLAALLHDRGESAEADRRSRQAVALTEALARIAPSLAVARADAHSLRGTILEQPDPKAAAQEFGQAVNLFADAIGDPALRSLPDFHLRVGDLLINLAAFSQSAAAGPEAAAFLSRAVDAYATVAGEIAATGSKADARAALDTITRMLPSIPERERSSLTDASRRLTSTLGGSR